MPLFPRKVSTHNDCASYILKIPVRAREAFLGLLLKIPFSGWCLRDADCKEGQRGEYRVQARDRVLPTVDNLFFFSFSTSFSMVPLDCPTREDGEVESFELFSNDITDEHSHAHGTCPKNKSLSAGKPSNLKTSISSPLLLSCCLLQTDSSLLSRQLLFLPFRNFAAYPPRPPWVKIAKRIPIRLSFPAASRSRIQNLSRTNRKMGLYRIESWSK